MRSRYSSSAPWRAASLHVATRPGWDTAYPPSPGPMNTVFTPAQKATQRGLVLRHVDQYFADCARFDGVVRVCCVGEREPVQRQAGVVAHG